MRDSILEVLYTMS